MEQRRYPVALIIGRFQPFHKGHLYLVKKALTIASKLVIGIGSSNIRNADNPISFQKRKQLVSMVFEKEGLADRLIKIVSIPDVPDDDEWLRITQKRVGSFHVSIGNNDWVSGIFRNASIPVIEAPYLKKSLYRGTTIRALAREGKPWEGSVPHYLVKDINKFLSLRDRTKKWKANLIVQ